MYSFIPFNVKEVYSVTRLAEWNTTRDAMRRNLMAFIHHYRNLAYSIPPDHVLVKFLQSINTPMALSNARYFNYIFDDALSVANALKMTTPFGTGQVFKGVFFNKNISEVLIAFTEDFDLDKVERRWENITAVRVLRHPFSSLKLQVPNGKYISPETGIAIMAINAPLLAVQYRAFVRSENYKASQSPEYVPRNVQQFIHAYVLPNMLESYLDYALFNRANCLLNDLPMMEFTVNSVIHQPDLRSAVDNNYKKVLKVLADSSYTAPMTLAAFPSFSATDMRSLIFVPDVVPTRQILWSTILSKLPLLLFMARAVKQDFSDLYGVRTLLDKLKRQRVLDSALPKEFYQDAMAEIDEILDTI